MKRGLGFSVRGSLSPAFAPPRDRAEWFPFLDPKEQLLVLPVGPQASDGDL